jgi:hypothetical protein
MTLLILSRSPVAASIRNGAVNGVSSWWRWYFVIIFVKTGLWAASSVICHAGMLLRGGWRGSNLWRNRECDKFDISWRGLWRIADVDSQISGMFAHVTTLNWLYFRHIIQLQIITDFNYKSSYKCHRFHHRTADDNAFQICSCTTQYHRYLKEIFNQAYSHVHSLTTRKT